MKKYIPLKSNGTKSTHLSVELFYSLGGLNYWTSKEEPRGYYLSVTPVERYERNGIGMEGFIAFSGLKTLVKPVTRKSAKAEREAEDLAPEFEADLIAAVLAKNGLALA